MAQWAREALYIASHAPWALCRRPAEVGRLCYRLPGVAIGGMLRLAETDACDPGDPLAGAVEVLLCQHCGASRRATGACGRGVDLDGGVVTETEVASGGKTADQCQVGAGQVG